MGCLCNRVKRDSRGDQVEMQAGAEAEKTLSEGEIAGDQSKAVTMIRKVATKSDFDKEIANAKCLVLVDFYATWCGPCKSIGKALEKWAEEFDDVIFLKVDVDENDETAEACGIQAMPTLHYYKGGMKVDEIVGANEEKIKDKIIALK
ncbi:hypothetical protein BsWGS_02614 [Bradybaena similaris]